MASIRAAVGSRGRNRPADVKTVQTLLNRWQRNIRLPRPLAVDGFAGRRTVAAILAFQGRVVEMAFPDGRVDPGGETLRTLNRSPRFTLTYLPRGGGDGWYTYLTDAKRYGTPATLASIRRAARPLARLGLEVGVGNISLRNGGPVRPHSTHQMGVSVDLRPLRTDGRRLSVKIQAERYSRSDTVKLVRALRDDRNLKAI